MSNGYEIRLELLRMAKEVLAQRFHADCERARIEWEANKIGNLEYPEKYTMNDIIAEAVQLNKFINQKN